MKNILFKSKIERDTHRGFQNLRFAEECRPKAKTVGRKQ